MKKRKKNENQEVRRNVLEKGGKEGERWGGERRGKEGEKGVKRWEKEGEKGWGGKDGEKVGKREEVAEKRTLSS